MNVRGPDGKVIQFPDDTPPEQIKAAMAKHYGGPPRADSVGTDPTMMTAENNPWTQFAQSLKGRALGTLPTAGGIVGGLIGAGTPARIPLAAAGGAAGEAGREALMGGPMSAEDIAKSGAEQGAYEAAGGLIARGASSLARPIMRRALVVGKTIQKGFPQDVVETTLRKGIPVSKAGAAKATAMREASSRALSDLLADAKASGKTFRTADVTRQVRELLRDPVLPNKEKTRIFNQFINFMSQHGKKVDPVLLKDIKQFYQNRATSVYRAEGRGALTLAQENRGLFSKKLASGARQQLETIPGVAAREAETQSLIGAERAVEDAYMRPPRQFDLHRPGSYPVLNTLTNPAVKSHLAIALADPKLQALYRQSPRLFAALLEQMTYSDQPDVTAQP